MVRKLTLELSIMVGIALLLAVLGPFGTWQAPFALRLINWAIFTLGGYACFKPVILAGDALAAQSSLPRWAAIGVACLLASMPTTLIVAGTLSGFHWASLTAQDLGRLYPQILIIGISVTMVQLLVSRDRTVQGPLPGAMPIPDPAETPTMPAQAGDADDGPSIQPLLLEQLPPHLGNEILYIQNEDHYIRVHTAHGSALLLMRLRDAVAQLDGLDGAQVHRSWWVARAAVRDVVRSDRRILLTLVDGNQAPVSRSAAPLLKDRGWL